MDEVIPFDWHRIWFGEEAPAGFLLEIVFRSVIMYCLILGALRITGKRGVKQLSLFELTIILGLGSAAGDAMFYHDVPLLHALVVFVVVTLLYVFFNRLTESSVWVEQLLEGQPDCIIENGIIDLKAFKKQNLTYAELFGEMRQQQIEHLGQVRKVYLEATGELSIFFVTDEEVRPGLPILPEHVENYFQEIKTNGEYACWTCGNIEILTPVKARKCANCGKERWLEACRALRIT